MSRDFFKKTTNQAPETKAFLISGGTGIERLRKANELIEFTNAFTQKPEFLSLVQKINPSINKEKNDKFCKESIGLAFQSVNKFLSEEEKSGLSLEVWGQLGEAIINRWIRFQAFDYTQREIRKSINEVLLPHSEKFEKIR